MNKIDRADVFSAASVRATAGDPDAPRHDEAELNATAARIADQLGRDTVSPVMVSGILRGVEAFALFAISLAALYAYLGLPAVGQMRYLAASAFGGMLAMVLIEISDGYQVAALRHAIRWFPRIALIWTGTFAIMTLAGFFMKISVEFSRFWFAAWYLAGLAFLLAERLVISWRIRRWARNGTMERRAVIVGGGKPAERLIRSLEMQADNDIRICGIFDDRDDTRSPPLVAGYPKLGTVPELIAFARRARVDMLIVALPLNAEARVLAMLKKLWVLPVDIRLAAHNSQLRFRPRAYSYIGQVPMLDIFDKPINDWDWVAKRIFDIVFSLLGIVAFSPVMLATAIAIKLDSKGPVLFRQKRHGFNNEVIDVYKFRSMYTEMCDPTARQAVTKGDPRVTRVGRFIRKTSIDELPQFFNVLQGSLSLVGPRPHAVYAQTRDRMFAEVADGYFARHRVKPGVTGWAQINGWRGEIDNDDKIRMRTEYDLHYIENWSLWLDLKILFLTPIRLLKTDNAY